MLISKTQVRSLLASGLALIGSLAVPAQSLQMVRMPLPPNNFIPSAPSIVSYLPGYTASTSMSPYGCSNGAYDDQGNLLFYVVQNGGYGCGVVYDASGNAVGYLPSYSNSGSSFNHPGIELNICPVPGTCKRFDVIYRIPGFPGGNVLAYVNVDCSGSAPVMSVPADANIGFLSSSMGGIAVSKKIANGNRYLFAVDANGVYRYTISPAGIGSQVTTITSAQLYGSPYDAWYDTQQLELSPDQTALVWGATAVQSGYGKVWQVGLDANYNAAGSSHDFVYSIPTSSAFGSNPFPILGLEFSATSTRLYVCSNKGLYYLTPGATPNVTAVPNSAGISNTELELVYNGIIGVDNNGHLFRINPSTNVITSNLNSDVMYSNYSLGTPVAASYHLPDQIDGENYGHFFGVPTSTVQFLVNNSSVYCPIDQPEPILTVYANAPIILTNKCTNVYQYQLIVQSCDNAGNPIPGLYYNSGWVSTCPTDLQNLPGAGANATWLANGANAGYYTVQLATDDACGNSTYYACGMLQLQPLHHRVNPVGHTGGDLSAAFNYIGGDVFETAAFPNPAQGNVTIRKNTSAPADIFVYDILGSELLHLAQVSDENTVLDLRTYGKGVYLVKIVSGENKSMHRIVNQ